jgi:GAF domain-containing protein
VRSEAILDATDAHTDPRTSGFSASYLTPLRIQSMLDVPVWADGVFIGVLCCEHVGASTRDWSPAIQRFGLTLTQLLSQHWVR